jgi:hypothetical protein
VAQDGGSAGETASNPGRSRDPVFWRRSLIGVLEGETMIVSAVRPRGVEQPFSIGQKALRARFEQLPVRPLFGLLALCLIWGPSISATKLGLQFFPPLMLAACRYAAAAPFFALFLIGRPRPSRRALLGMAILGVIGIDIGQVAQILGVQQTEASVATVISATIPIFVVVLASWRSRDASSRIKPVSQSGAR